jgi:hypothetical protein
MIDKTSREILDAIDFALKETAARAAAGKLEVVGGMLSQPLRLPPSTGRADHGEARPKSSREILDAIDKALKETRRRLAEVDNAVRNPAATDRS